MRRSAEHLRDLVPLAGSPDEHLHPAASRAASHARCSALVPVKSPAARSKGRATTNGQVIDHRPGQVIQRYFETAITMR